MVLSVERLGGIRVRDDCEGSALLYFTLIGHDVSFNGTNSRARIVPSSEAFLNAKKQLESVYVNLQDFFHDVGIFSSWRVFICFLCLYTVTHINCSIIVVFTLAYQFKP